MPDDRGLNKRGDNNESEVVALFNGSRYRVRQRERDPQQPDLSRKKESLDYRAVRRSLLT
jgi:hypothetical protein